jgi:hypothetical protein
MDKFSVQKTVYQASLWAVLRVWIACQNFPMHTRKFRVYDPSFVMHELLAQNFNRLFPCLETNVHVGLCIKHFSSSMALFSPASLDSIFLQNLIRQDTCLSLLSISFRKTADSEPMFLMFEFQHPSGQGFASNHFQSLCGPAIGSAFSKIAPCFRMFPQCKKLKGYNDASYELGRD